jgi:hypothetical protein
MWRLKKRLSFIISCVCVCVCVCVCGWVSVYILHFNTIYDHVALAEAALPFKRENTLIRGGVYMTMWRLQKRLSLIIS